jgi:hypothetical protein
MLIKKKSDRFEKSDENREAATFFRQSIYCAESVFLKRSDFPSDFLSDLEL